MIEWKVFDPENPPEEGLYLIHQRYETAHYVNSRVFQGNWKHGKWHTIALGFMRDVTHYAELNLPEQRGGLVNPDGGNYPLKWMGERGFKGSETTE